MATWGSSCLTTRGCWRPASCTTATGSALSVGRTLSARVVATVLRGQTIYRDGRLVGEPRGRLLIQRLNETSLIAAPATR